MIPNSGNDKPSLPLDNSILHRISPGSSRVFFNVNQFNDENQQNLRIQQAVNRYNGTGLPPYWRPSATFKCNLFKGKTLKPFATDDNVSCDDSKQMPETRYASPGHFPTVFLGKNQVRPSTKQTILSQLRSNASGLPVSRFLDDSAEKYSDVKPTRSVLEVLQDLSRKRIHGKDESEDSSKRRCRGLGGDLIIEGEIPFQPLFVSKQKIQNFPKKDQMTQTLSDLILTDGNKAANTQDSKWELRKKLAQKNNEIFASLSSSIASTFFAKRKRASISNVPDADEKFIKKKRVETAVVNSEEVNLIDLGKKSIRKEPGPRSPPTKDRLMNIYFDLQNNSNEFKGDVIKAMKSETDHSQFQRQETSVYNDFNTSAANDSIIKALNSTPNESNSEIDFSHKQSNEARNDPALSTPQISFSDNNLSPNTFNNKKATENIVFGQLDTKLETKSEKAHSPGLVVATTASFSIANTSMFLPSLAPLEKDSKLVDSPVSFSASPKINTESSRISPTKIANTEIGPITSATLSNEHSKEFKLDQKHFPSPTSVKDAFNINADKTTSLNNFSLGLSKPEMATLHDEKPSADTKLGFSFGDSKISFSTPTFSFNPTKSLPPASSFNQASLTNLPSSKFGEKLSDSLVSSGSFIDSGNSIPIKKPADTTSTFTFGNLKSTSSPSVAPSLFTSVPQKSTSEITPPTSCPLPAPVFSFNQSTTGLPAKTGFFSFGSDAQTISNNEAKPDAKTNTLNEGFSFGNSLKNPLSTLNSGSEIYKNSNQDGSIIKDNKLPLATSSLFSNAPSAVTNKINNMSSFPKSNVFSRLGSTPDKNSVDDLNYLKPKEMMPEIITVGDPEQVNQIVYGHSKLSNDSNLFAGGSLFGSGLSTMPDIATTYSGPLFTQTNSPIATSSVFSFKSSDQPSFKFGPPSASSAPLNSTEAKAFVFGSMTNTPSVGEDKTGITTNELANTTAKSSTSSIFSFGPEKPTEVTSNFTFGKLPIPPTAQPFAFGNSQSDTISSTSSSQFPAPPSSNTSKTVVGFGIGPSSTTLTGNQPPASVPVTAPPAFSATASTFSFGSDTLHSSPFGTSNNLFGATTSANPAFGQTNPAVGPTTTAPPPYSSATTFNTTTAAPLNFGSGTSSGTGTFESTNITFGTNTSAPPAFGSGMAFNTTTSATTFGATTTAPVTFGSGTAFGTTPSAPTFGNVNTFGTPPSTSSAFGNTNTFASNTTAPTAFGGSTAFVTTTSTPSTFGSLTSFGASSSSNTASNIASGFGNPTGTAAFGSNGGTSPFASAGNAFGTSQLPSFGNTGTAFNSSTNAFGNSVPASTFGNAPPPYTANTTFGSASASGNNNLAFGSNVSSTTTFPTPFGNSTPTSTAFGFGAGNTTTNSTVPSFNFGATSASSSQANNSFNFGAPNTAGSSGSSVFNFGGNSASSNSKPFCFGSNTSGSSAYSQPTPGPSGFPAPSTQFNATTTPNPSTSFSLPGTFSIGSGSTQPRSRTVSRFRRRT